jgi:hypothetical protein
VDGLWQYKVRWAGYGQEDDSWEARDNLRGKRGRVCVCSVCVCVCVCGWATDRRMTAGNRGKTSEVLVHTHTHTHTHTHQLYRL